MTVRLFPLFSTGRDGIVMRLPLRNPEIPNSNLGPDKSYTLLTEFLF